MFLLINSMYLFCCSGELVFYVRSNSSETNCPNGTDPTVDCRQLSEYANTPDPLLDPNTTFVFLPGEHTLSAPFLIYVNPSANASVKLTSSEIGCNRVISCQNESAYLSFQSLHLVEVEFLSSSSCGLSVTEVETTMVRHSRFMSTTKLASGLFSILTLLYGNCVIEDCNFENNSVPLITLHNGSLHLRGNQINYNMESWLGLHIVNATITNNSFTNNNMNAIAGIIMSGSVSLWFTGTNTFNLNSGMVSAVVYCFSGLVVLEGITTFTNNTGVYSGVMSGVFFDLQIRGEAYFENNTGYNGGALYSLNGNFHFSGKAVFSHNFATYGGAIYLVSSEVLFTDDANINFTGNSAANGGSLVLSSRSFLNFLDSSTVTFEQNSATLRGGAIWIQDSNFLSYCTTLDFTSVELCSFLFNESGSTINVYFYRNHAVEAGSAIYGGAVDVCVPSLTRSNGFIRDNPFNRRTYFDDDNIGFDNINASISSDPFQIISCDKNCLGCSNITKSVFPGGTLDITVVAVGQRGGAVPASILAVPSGGLTIGELEGIQGIPRGCSVLTYTIYAPPGNGTINFTADGPCLFRGRNVAISVEVLDCPPGFDRITGVQTACICHPRLLRYTDTCNLNNGTISHNGKFWVGYDQMLKGLIIFSTCPFDYCITDEISLNPFRTIVTYM